jgi:hypothetical protein
MRSILLCFSALPFGFINSTTAVHAQVNPHINQGFHPCGSYARPSIGAVGFCNGPLNIPNPGISHPREDICAYSSALTTDHNLGAFKSLLSETRTRKRVLRTSCWVINSTSVICTD